LATVFHSEVDGELAPYTYEQRRLDEAGIGFSAGLCADSRELVARAEGADIVWLEWAGYLTNEVLEQLPECQLVIRWGIGVDPIDLEGATRLGVAVANCPSYCVRDVAEHTIGLLLAVTRNIPSSNALVHAGGWELPDAASRRLAGGVLGIVGLGNIGRAVAKVGESLGCRVLAHDVRVPAGADGGPPMVGLDQLLSEADFVSLHVSLGPTSRHLIDDRAIGLMKDDAVLVNTCRGAIVDQEALVRALQGGKFFGVGLDVFEDEPLGSDNPLRRIDRAVLTPHQGGNSPESLTDLRREVCDTTIEWVTTGWAKSVVNPGVKDRRRNVRREQA
jgi:D-3-phosphoglycerate dehydrogenase / 2-oxoglutarate reductase